MALNRERVATLRQMLVDIETNPLLDEEGHPITFDMETYIMRRGCGTAACIAGHLPFHPVFAADGWVYYDDRVMYKHYQPERGAANYFGITYNDAWELFVEGYDDLANVTTEDAINKLDDIVSRYDANGYRMPDDDEATE